MPKIAKEISAAEVRKINQTGNHRVGGIPGLILKVSETGAKRWILRISIGGKRCDLGLGAYPEISLVEAKKEAKNLRAKVQLGINPLQERKAAKRKLQESQLALARTFEKIAHDCWQIKAAEFKNQKHIKQWYQVLQTYAFPQIGKMPIADITPADCVRVLQPIWLAKPETAQRVRIRMCAVFDYAKAAGLRQANNPAEWRGCLEPLLPTHTRATRKVQHMPSLRVEDAPRLYQHLINSGGSVSALALQFLILTACRSSEVRLLCWEDIQDDIIKLPAERMKAGKAHILPITPELQKLLDFIPQTPSPNVFLGQRKATLSDQALSQMLKILHQQALAQGEKGYQDADSKRITTPHGLRSTFKDWARRYTDYADEVSELQLAHVNNDSTRAAYARDSLLDKRRQLMTAWEDFLNQSS